MKNRFYYRKGWRHAAMLYVAFSLIAPACSICGQPTTTTNMTLPVTSALSRFATRDRGGIISFTEGHSPPPIISGNEETRPAETDPRGHWGSVCNGLQLGLRFAKEEFTIGEKIHAYVIVRNPTSTNRIYFLRGGHTPASSFMGWNSQDQEIPATKRWLIPRPSSSYLPAGSQDRYWACLNRVFDLTVPGKYTFQVTLDAEEGLASGKAVITIRGQTNLPACVGITNMP